MSYKSISSVLSPSSYIDPSSTSATSLLDYSLRLCFMEFHPNTSLHLCPPNTNDLNLELVLEPSSSSPSSPHSPASSEPRVFSCNYCQRKFYSSQALGGHQNAHKLERTLAKKSRELSSAVRAHKGSNISTIMRSSSSSSTNLISRRSNQETLVGFEQHGHVHGGSYGMNYESSWSMSYGDESVQEEFCKLDLSLRL